MVIPLVEEGVNFGPLPTEVDNLLQEGVVAYRRDRTVAEQLFRRALDSAPEHLAGWNEDVARWQPAPVPSDGPERFALYTLKALAFVHLKRDDLQRARGLLDALARLDPQGLVGWRVVDDLAKGLR